PNPAGPGKKDRKPYDVQLRDFEQNGMRDTALHWIVLDEEYKKFPFGMDPFGAEYVSEVVSMMATYYQRKAEEIAKADGAKEVKAQHMARVRDKQYVQVMPRAADEKAAWTPEQEKKKKAALAKYPANLYKNVTAASGLPAGPPKLPPLDPAVTS